ncbi:signal transduction histidine kinase/ActR/RegA family two-component response regulator [Loktanella ponticola]|uniref:histidine kinase n=1 Tax=Yoonia ponticola TaxID=1524255 RepID=A0A7W9BIP0_9RHOB|nr:PAS-domain containing protein [Yoonia ponticola]MBB5721234.1 signal transduction histidine kinase/ActR/RegA family two-component response regulator [Yoonia ponticola]
MSIVNPDDTIERQNEKLLVIAQSLMRRVEQKNDQSGLAYQQFERAALLETQVRQRTQELERTLDLLQESNARLEDANVETETARSNITEAIETINEGFALFDPDERLVLFNSRFCRDIADVADHLVEGLPFQGYVELLSRSPHLAMEDGESPDDWAASRLSRHSHDHVVFNVRLMWNRWLQISEHRTARGGTVILQTDVTDMMRSERQQREQLLDQQARILQATLDHLNQGVCIFNHTKTLVGWNKTMSIFAAMPSGDSVHGLTFSALLDNIRAELTFHEGFDHVRLERWANHRSRRKPIAFEVTRNDVQILSVFAQEMPDRGFVISFTDVTAEREAARALADMNETLEAGVIARTEELGVALAEAERANASKSRFVAAASHDLLQPLSAAKLFMSSLSDQLESPQTLTVLGKAETALAGVEKIIAALLDISKLDAGKAVFDVQPVSLSAIFGPLRDELTPVAMAKGLSLTIIDSSLSVQSDPGYLRRITQNLISNAIKYTTTGRVVVGVRRNGGSARIEVWDTGPGIAETDRLTVFQEFERLDGAAPNDGLGLGLAIVERAAKGLGHDLSLWSQVGRGSCFALNALVAVSSSDKAMGLPNFQADWGNALEGMIILLVENDTHLATAMTLMMENHGAEVLPAASAQEAKDLLGEIQLVPDVLLLDYQLGAGASGIDLYRDLQATCGDVPAAMISADRSQALRQGCAALSLKLLAKPIDKEKLLSFLVVVREDVVDRDSYDA